MRREKERENEGGELAEMIMCMVVLNVSVEQRGLTIPMYALRIPSIRM